MFKLKFISVLALAVFLSTSCSIVDKLKEKLSSKKDSNNREKTVNNDDKNVSNKEETVNGSENDFNFYNKYIDVLNKVSETGDNVYKEYLTEVPNPKSLRKNTMVLALSFQFKVNDMENILRDYRRSLFDGGELSKLSADNKDMKKEIESDFKDLLNVLEVYYISARKTSDYYKNKEFQNDLSLASTYDDEMKAQHEKYRSAIDKLNSTVRKYKPARKIRDISKISDPDEKSVAVLMNTYENTLDNAEDFYGDFQKVSRNDDVNGLKSKLDKMENNFNDDKKSVESVSFTEKTKYMKYNFQDYFQKQTDTFISDAGKFLNQAAQSKMSESEFNRGYDNVITSYNNMINAYNTSIQIVNTFRVY